MTGRTGDRARQLILQVLDNGRKSSLLPAQFSDSFTKSCNLIVQTFQFVIVPADSHIEIFRKSAVFFQ